MSTENLFRMTAEELEKAYEDAIVRSNIAKEEAKIFLDECNSRHFDVRMGQRIEIEGRQYVVVGFDDGLNLAIIKKDGSRSGLIRHPIAWFSFRAGQKSNPW